MFISGRDAEDVFKEDIAPLFVDTYFARGFQEQRVFVVPSKNLVLVRFGATSVKSGWNDDAFVASMLAALSE